MTVIMSYIPVIEELLIDKLTKYFMSQCNWATQFPNFPSIRINNEYPWVPYMKSAEYYSKGWIDLSEVPDLFPSLTIVSSDDSKSRPEFTDLKKQKLDRGEFAQFEDLMETEGYLISPDGLAAMQSHFASNPYLYGMGITYNKRDTVNFDITTDDSTNIKNRIYDLLTLFLAGHGGNALFQDENIRIIEDSLSGSRSGIYNLDFGRALRGATISVKVDYTIQQVFYDTDAGTVTDVEIDHTVSIKE